MENRRRLLRAVELIHTTWTEIYSKCICVSRCVCIYIYSCIAFLRTSRKRGKLCGSPSYTAARCTSMVGYLSRGLWSRLHLHNSAEAASLSPPLLSSLAHTDTPVLEELKRRRPCGKLKYIFFHVRARDVIHDAAVETAGLQKEKDRLVNLGWWGGGQHDKGDVGSRLMRLEWHMVEYL